MGAQGTKNAVRPLGWPKLCFRSNLLRGYIAQTQADHSKQTGTLEKLRKWFLQVGRKLAKGGLSISALWLVNPCHNHWSWHTIFHANSTTEPDPGKLLCFQEDLFEGVAWTRPGRLCVAPVRRCFRRITRKASKCPPRLLIFPYRLPGDPPPNQIGDARDFKEYVWTAVT